jgi:hypothetical protein
VHPPVDCKEDNPLNNNRGSNRRRGRGNNRQQGGGQGNRIDSRARGNAPQMLEKYRKLAHDASLNGDRVQSEYYLQFADHYFRVVADSRVQRDDQRPQQQQGNREQSSSYDEEFRDDDEQHARGGQRENGRDNSRDGASDGRRERPHDGRQEREQGNREESDARAEGDDFEPVENPFVRDNRGGRQDRERQDRAPAEASNENAAEGEPGDEGRFDPSSLPPSLGAAESEPAEKPRRKPRKPRATENDGEELETVN